MLSKANLIEVVTPPSIYHGFYTRNNFWEEKFTQVNMKNCFHCNVSKHREINNVEQDIALDVSLKFGNPDKMKITSSEPKFYLLISGNGLTTSLGLNTNIKLN